MKCANGKIKVYISEYRSLDEVRWSSGDNLLGIVSYSNHDLTDNGYTVIGEAEISLTVMDDEQIVLNKIASLTKQKQTALAEAQVKAMEIDGEIQKLLAITYVPEESEESGE